jgi:hypothetical protein
VLQWQFRLRWQRLRPPPRALGATFNRDIRCRRRRSRKNIAELHEGRSDPREPPQDISHRASHGLSDAASFGASIFRDLDLFAIEILNYPRRSADSAHGIVPSPFEIGLSQQKRPRIRFLPVGPVVMGLFAKRRRRRSPKHHFYGILPCQTEPSATSCCLPLTAISQVSNTSTISLISQRRSVTFSAIAGEVRSVLCMQTKL